MIDSVMIDTSVCSLNMFITVVFVHSNIYNSNQTTIKNLTVKVGKIYSKKNLHTKLTTPNYIYGYSIATTVTTLKKYITNI